MIGDHGGVPPVVFQNRRLNVIPLVPGKIDIDIRRVRTARVQKTLEVKVVLQRTHIGYPQAKGHQGRSP